MKKEQQQDRRTFWRSHVEARESFGGSTKEYCRQHGLKESHTIRGSAVCRQKTSHRLLRRST